MLESNRDLISINNNKDVKFLYIFSQRDVASFFLLFFTVYV